MKNSILIFFLVIIQISFAQKNGKSLFKKIIKEEGNSTSPNYLVVTIKNLNSNQTKEIFLNKNDLFYAFEEELNINNECQIRKTLLKHSKNRFFEIRNPKALKRLGFDSYQMKNISEIEKLFSNNYITNGIKKLELKKKEFNIKLEKYSIKRFILLEKIRDSLINSNGELKEYEDVILSDLMHYNNENEYKERKDLSKAEKELIALWNRKSDFLRKDEIEKEIEIVETEVKYLENKFIYEPYNKYGVTFFHIAYNKGLVFARTCHLKWFYNGEIK